MFSGRLEWPKPSADISGDLWLGGYLGKPCHGALKMAIA